MKNEKNKEKLKRIEKPLIITCPACGYSFQKINPKSRKKVKACPMCGYKFLELNGNSNNHEDFKRRLI